MKSFNKLFVFKKLKSLFIYVFDKEVPFFKKIFIVLGFVYLLFPFDIIPDTILGLGIIDDITIILIIYKYFKNELEKYEYLKKDSNARKKEKNIIKDVEYSINDEGDED